LDILRGNWKTEEVVLKYFSQLKTAHSSRPLSFGQKSPKKGIAMVATQTAEATISAENTRAENRVLLRDITWNVYEIILNARGERRSPLPKTTSAS
jgi:hypothetical protein